MKKSFTISEQIVVEKTVEIEVTDDMTDDEIEEAVKEKAYEQTISDFAHEHGWEGTDVIEVRIYDDETGKELNY